MCVCADEGRGSYLASNPGRLLSLSDSQKYKKKFTRGGPSHRLKSYSAGTDLATILPVVLHSSSWMVSAIAMELALIGLVCYCRVP